MKILPPETSIPWHQPPPTMLDVPPARLRSCASSGTHGLTLSNPNLFIYEP